MAEEDNAAVTIDRGDHLCVIHSHMAGHMLLRVFGPKGYMDVRVDPEEIVKLKDLCEKVLAGASANVMRAPHG